MPVTFDNRDGVRTAAISGALDPPTPPAGPGLPAGPPAPG